MCSGCSGYYEGDDEEDRGTEADARVERDGWRAAGGEEAGSGNYGQDGRYGHRSRADSRDAHVNAEADSEEEEYEVAVSAEMIIERRRIRCKPSTMRVIEGNSGYAERGGSWHGVQQSGATSARYYQPYTKYAAKQHSLIFKYAKHLILCGLWAIAAAALAYWMAAR